MERRSANNSSTTHSGGASGRNGGDGPERYGQSGRSHLDPTGNKPKQNSGGSAGGSRGSGSHKIDDRAAGKKPRANYNDRATASIVEKNGNTETASKKRQTIVT
ncbi:uncharacterized protein Bfra_011081 [Botrytis fragariae]|uniref:Uncharacterized protein n=1 Tax=Botrytis fragariae TaxID=1964551 RepID=A0A8H6AKA2_9HELO|nr:uncharacterized protein Bfra_011081 [Botrytis fragariae]KAF5869273.1 hypothetical protein Bfra_011081 [Botrytis fragariae]